jgi:tetratricopeptide (TPR) repeat protein
MRIKLFILCFITLLLTACEKIAVHFTPQKQAEFSHSALAIEAEKQFWETLHQGKYNNIPMANRLLMAAYLENPNDPTIAAHLGFLHIWKITERYRHTPLEPTIVDEIILARKYFSDAIELNPSDARFAGFFADSQLMEGKIFHDARQQTRGYFALQHAIRAWPEFNYFTGGYVMSIFPPDSARFKEGLEWQWKTLDLCAQTTIDRNNPDFSPYMHLETQTGPKRACWNSWIAPHNFEGFFLNMGDMLVKSGYWQTAIKMYRNAALAHDYATWPYRHILEKRITDAKANVKNFQKDYSGPNKTIMFNAGYGCMVCHQNR